MDRYITIKPWETNAPYHLELAKNDLVEVAEKQPDKPEWKDWVWCHDSLNSGWVPRHIIKTYKDQLAKVLEDYSAKELSIGAGEVIIGYKEYCGWVWSQNDESGEKGWLPEEILLKLSK